KVPKVVVQDGNRAGRVDIAQGGPTPVRLAKLRTRAKGTAQACVQAVQRFSSAARGSPGKRQKSEREVVVAGRLFNVEPIVVKLPGPRQLEHLARKPPPTVGPRQAVEHQCDPIEPRGFAHQVVIWARIV